MQSTSAARDFGTPLALEDVKDFASLGPYPLERCDVAVQCALPRKMPVDKGQPLLPSASSKSPSECALCKSRHNYDLNGYKELEKLTHENYALRGLCCNWRGFGGIEPFKTTEGTCDVTQVPRSAGHQVAEREPKIETLIFLEASETCPSQGGIGQLGFLS